MTDTGPTAIALRVVFNDSNGSSHDRWLARLQSAGVSITHDSGRAIDVSGPTEVLRNVLHIEIEFIDGAPQVTAQPDLTDEPAPSVYAPRPPTFFN